jgi:Holliday junction resolvase RusA-like endonuclease
MIKRYCGVCKDFTEQICDKEHWICAVCKTVTEDAPGCRIEFVVKGAPVPKARPRAAMRGEYPIIYTPKNTVQFERYVKQIATEHAPPKPLTGAICLDLKFMVQRPQSLPAKIRYNTKKPDIDNLAKSVMDALEGIIYERDAQIVSLLVNKDYGPPCCDIIIEELAER